MKRLIIKQLARTFDFFKSVYFYMRYESFRDKYDLDTSFRFNGDNIIFYGDGKIIIEEKSYVGSNSTIQSEEGCVVRIGKYCSISHNVRMYTSSNDSQQNFVGSVKRLKRKGDIKIGDGVWIGVNVVINPGITIGNNAVVGANSVVTKSVESNTVVGGVPARFIKMINID